MPSRRLLAVLVIVIGLIVFVALRTDSAPGADEAGTGLAEGLHAGGEREEVRGAGILREGASEPVGTFERAVVPVALPAENVAVPAPLVAPAGGLLVRVVGEDGTPRASIPVALVVQVPEQARMLQPIVKAVTRSPDGLATLAVDLRKKKVPRGVRFFAAIPLPLEPYVSRELVGWTPGEAWDGGTIELVLPANAEAWLTPLVVEVVDASGAPVADADVELVARQRLSPGSANQLGRAKTRAPDGRAEISREEWIEHLERSRVMQLTFDPVVRCSGPFTDPPEVKLSSTPSLEPVRLVLPPTGVIEVRPRNADGSAVGSGVLVLLACNEPGKRERLCNLHSPVEQGLARFVVGLGLDVQVHPYYECGDAEGEWIQRPGPAKEGEVLSLEPAFGEKHPRLVGRLVDEHGTAAAGMHFWFDGQALQADEEGRFAIPWPERRRSVVQVLRFEERDDPKLGTPKDWIPRFADVEAPAQGTERRSDLGDVLLREVPIVLAGRVVDEGGAPLNQAQLSIQRSLPAAGDPVQRHPGSPAVTWENLKLPGNSRASTRADGRFEIRSLESAVELRVSATGRNRLASEQVVVAPGTRNVELVLRAPEEVDATRGRVVGGLRIEEHVPWPWIEVALVRGRGEKTRVPIGGRFVLENLRPGTYRLELRTAETRWLLAAIDGVVIEAGATTSDARLESIDLSGLTRIWKLRVHGSDGEPLARERLRIRALERDGSLETASDGSLFFSHRSGSRASKSSAKWGARSRCAGRPTSSASTSGPTDARTARGFEVVGDASTSTARLDRGPTHARAVYPPAPGMLRHTASESALIRSPLRCLAVPQLLAALLLLGSSAAGAQAPAKRVFERGDRVCLVGNSLAERIQFDGWLEARLQARLPGLELVFRNLGFAADELSVQQRTSGFGTLDEHLGRCRASVVLAFFGYVESFRGVSGLEKYKADLAGFVDHLRAQRYDGEHAPRIVLFSPLACEDLRDAHLPEAKAENARMTSYALATAEVARAKDVVFVDLFASMLDRYASEPPLTIDGVHLNERGNAVLAEVIEAALVPIDVPPSTPERIAALRPLVVLKDQTWRDRWHTTDGYNVYGGRSSLEYDGLTNFTVLQRELEVLAKMAENQDRRIQAIARGEKPGPDEPLPEQIPVPTNKPGPNQDGSYPFLSGERAISKMTPAKGLSVSLFADETRFPELANPVQMSFDARGRLWVACWPTYPHWKPGTARADKLLVLEDRDGDGRADRANVFADNLQNPTGFEFWNGGVLLAAAPDLVFLKDEDGDGRADRREVLLSGLSSADTHHTANSFVIGPDGGLYFQEGVFHQTQIESVRGPVRNHDACVWRYEPRTRSVERYAPYPFLNPHGHVFDRWGQDFITDGTGNENFYALPITAHAEEPRKLPGTEPFFPQRSRPAAATEILSSRHFPADFAESYLVANVIGFQGIFRYRLEDRGSGFGASELEPIVHSADPSFRPVDLEVGPDGALTFLDWQNPLIGHMQHHLRDPSRDHTHGRIYRVTANGRPLLERATIAEAPIAKLCELLKSPEDRVRYRARIELGARPPGEVVAAVRAWAAALDETDADVDHHRLEALWAEAQHAVLDHDLVERLLGSGEPRARAAALRILRHWRDQEPDALAIFARSMRDVHPRVRLEALTALGFFPDRQAVEGALAALALPSDRFLEYALDRTLEALEPAWREALLSGEPFLEENPAGLARLVARLSTDELAQVFPSAVVHESLLARHGVEPARIVEALDSLAELRDSSAADELVRAIERLDERGGEHADHALADLFGACGELQPAQRVALAPSLRSLATGGRRPSTRRLAAVARLRAEGSVEPAWTEASRSLGALGDLLDALPLLGDPALGKALFPHVRALLDGAPPELARELSSAPGTRGRYVRIELPGRDRTLTLAEVEVLSAGTSAAARGRATQSSTAWNAGAERAIDGNKSGAFEDRGQTHTQEGVTDPWWEVDLGAENAIDRIVVTNRDEQEGRFASRLDGYVLRVLDRERRTVFERTTARASAKSDVFELSSPLARVRGAAARALVALGVEQQAAVEALVARFGDLELQPAIVASLRSVPLSAWPAGAADALGARVLEQFGARPEAELESAAGRELLALADELAPALSKDLAAKLRRARKRLGPQVVVIRPVPDSLTYDRRAFSVAAGRPVELVFSNTDIMPHNLVLTAPGALAKVGLAAEAMAADPEAASKSYVPAIPEVLHATRLVSPGESQTLSFEAPAEIGDHPYVCTFPGHWVRMNGVMHVVASPDELDEPATAAAAAVPARHFVRAWKFADLADDVLLGARGSAARGRKVLEDGSCLRCHAIDNEGGTTGPDLREVATRHDDTGLLAHVLEPSRSILAGFGAETFVTREGSLYSGRVLSEDAGGVVVQADPYSPEGTRLSREEIESRRPAAVSIMPEGLLSTFERQEILDLLCYLRSLAKPPVR